MYEEIFDHAVGDPQKLNSYGFTQTTDGWALQVPLLDSFTLHITVSWQTVQGERELSKISHRLIDDATGEEYTLHLVSEAKGSFVAQVRTGVQAVLTAVAQACFTNVGLQAPLTQRLVEHIAQTYGAQPEFLWKKYPTTAIWRHQSNQKWFAITMPVQRKKLNLAGDGEVQVVNVHLMPLQVEQNVDEKTMFRGYHMNKKTWLTILLDGSVPWETVCELINTSHFLTR